MKSRTVALISPGGVEGLQLIPSVRVLGVPLHPLSLDDLLVVMESWVAHRGKPRWIALTSSHGIVEARKKTEFRSILETADLSIPDGKWTAHVAGLRAGTAPCQVRGADLLSSFCRIANQKGYSNFFFGDTEEVLASLSCHLRAEYPALKIAGTLSPPFKSFSQREDEEMIEAINKAKPDVLWVGLGLPKQEIWIAQHRHQLSVPVIVAIGAGFKFVSGKIKPAPKRISELGLEWFWRLLTEPRRVWHRALVYGPQFALHTFLEIKGLKRYD